jgi:DNA primase
LIAGRRSLWIAFDADPAGQHAARTLRDRLHRAGQPSRQVLLPPPHDPASYFAAGASAEQFRALLHPPRPSRTAAHEVNS